MPASAQNKLENESLWSIPLCKAFITAERDSRVRNGMNWKYILCLSLSLLFFIQMCPIPESARSMDYYPPHPGECAYQVYAIRNQDPGLVRLDEIRLTVKYPNGTISFSMLLSEFNTSGNPYYNQVKFKNEFNLSVLDVGDAFFFNKTIYWGGSFSLTNADVSMQYCQNNIMDEYGRIDVYNVFFTDGPIDTFPFNLEGLFLFLIFITATALLIIFIMRTRNKH